MLRRGSIINGVIFWGETKQVSENLDIWFLHMWQNYNESTQSVITSPSSSSHVWLQWVIFISSSPKAEINKQKNHGPNGLGCMLCCKIFLLCIFIYNCWQPESEKRKGNQDWENLLYQDFGPLEVIKRKSKNFFFFFSQIPEKGERTQYFFELRSTWTC